MVLISAKDKRCPRRCRGVQHQLRQTLSMASYFGGQAIMLTRPQAASRDRLLMADSVNTRPCQEADFKGLAPRPAKADSYLLTDDTDGQILKVLP